jgi:hypothetical protein
MELKRIWKSGGYGCNNFGNRVPEELLERSRYFISKIFKGAQFVIQIGKKRIYSNRGI